MYVYLYIYCQAGPSTIFIVTFDEKTTYSMGT